MYTGSQTNRSLEKKGSYRKKNVKDIASGQRKAKVILQKENERQELTIQILTLLNKLDYKGNIIYDILMLIKQYTGIEAAGIRLNHGDDYPYYIAKGFPVKFVEAEKYLCMRNSKGNIVKDRNSKPVLECMCGNVIRGKTDPAEEFFTQGGSFWTNSTTRLLANTPQENLQAHTRNRCNREGYESVALIPLHSDRTVIGLLQLNDKRAGMLNRDVVEFFEGIGASIGISIAHLEAEKKLKESEKEYRELAGQLSEANEMKNLLLDVITHDLRNAAGTIYSFAGILKEQLPDYEYGDIIQLSSKSLLKVINNTTSLAQINLGEEIEKEIKDICAIVKDTLKEFHISGKEMEFEIVFNPDKSLYANVNPIISEIFRNYIGNALKHAYEGKKLVVEALEENNNIIIKIKDFGTTIAKDKRKVIFERSVRLNKDKMNSSGVGLAIVKRIAAAHNGEVWVEPNTPKGNSFCLKLPAAQKE